MRNGVGLFDVSHLGKARGLRAGRRGVRQRDADQRPRPDRAGPGAVHAVLRRRDRRRRRRPDRLPPHRRAGAARAQRRQHRRGRAPPRGDRPRRASRSSTTTATTRSSRCRARCPTRCSRRVGLPTGHDYMSFAEAEHAGVPVVVCRSGYTGEKGYELIVPCRRRAGSCGTRSSPPARRTGCSPAASAPATPCAPRWATRCTARTSAPTSRRSRRRLGWAVGWGKEQFWGRVGAAGREGGRPAPAAARPASPSVAASRGPGMQVSLTPDVPLCEITSGTFSPTLRKGIGMALVPTMVAPDAEVAVDIRGRREVFQLVRAAVRRPVGAGGLSRGQRARPAADLPRAEPDRAALVVAPRGQRRRRGRRSRASSPTSASPARPTPSRGWGRRGPTSPRSGSTR